MSEEEIKFRAYLLVLNSEFPTHRKTEAMEELIKIYNKQQKEIEELQKDKKVLVKNYDKVLGTFISKDKIRDKIKEVIQGSSRFNVLCKINENEDTIKTRYAVQVLTELLEEESVWEEKD